MGSTATPRGGEGRGGGCGVLLPKAIIEKVLSRTGGIVLATRWPQFHHFPKKERIIPRHRIELAVTYSKYAC